MEPPRIHADFNACLEGDRFWVLDEKDLEKYRNVLEQGLEVLRCDLDDEFHVRARLERVRGHWWAAADMSTIVYRDDPTTG